MKLAYISLHCVGHTTNSYRGYPHTLLSHPQYWITRYSSIISVKLVKINFVTEIVLKNSTNHHFINSTCNFGFTDTTSPNIWLFSGLAIWTVAHHRKFWDAWSQCHYSAPRHLTQAIRKYSNVMPCHGEYWLYCWSRYMAELQLKFVTWNQTPNREDLVIHHRLGTTSSWVTACRVLESSPNHSLSHKKYWCTHEPQVNRHTFS